MRSVFEYMTRDIQQAYASSNNPAAVFIASSGQSGGQSTSGGLLTLMTRGNRLVSNSSAGGPIPSQGSAAPSQRAPAGALPQSETSMVRYDFDPQVRTLSRTVVGVPSLQALQQTPAGPDKVITSLVQDISLRFWDPTALSWRNDWDYEQQNQQSASGASGATTGTASDPASAAPATGSASSGSGDTTLPGSVEVTVTIRHADSTTATYIATIPVVTSQVADGMAPPANTGANTTSSARTGAAQ